MPYFTPQRVAASISALVGVHPFYGITFLACKKGGLPIGRAVVFPLDAETDKFLRQYHRIDPGSDWFFQPFKFSDAAKKWVRPDYSAKGLQAINTQTFGPAFIHERNTRIWGWAPNYVQKLLRDRKIPAFDLLVWVFRDREWPEGVTADHVVQTFLLDFQITKEEESNLFHLDPPAPSEIARAFQPNKPIWKDISLFIPSPPDAKPDQGGTLAYLETRGLGPADVFILEPADRLTLITGDNGLGKSFLLEAAWWTLTGTWADRALYPTFSQPSARAEISFAIKGEASEAQRRTISFDWRSLSWPQPRNRPTIAGLIVYARVDGSFAVWDPARQSSGTNTQRESKIIFSSSEIWDGILGRIEGLIRDWVRWQSNPSKYPYEEFLKVLEHLSPPDLGRLQPGPTTRIPDDPRDIPTIVHPYGETPIVYASAGVRRVVALAYLIVWAWHEHVVAAQMAQIPPQRRMVVLIDEIEAHLHPRWQRDLLPALMDLGELLASTLRAQYLVATHSPLVMASSEPVFSPATDKLGHLDMETTGEVTLRNVNYVKFGDVSNWLTSPVFELRHARSNEGEAAIEAAKKLQLRSDVEVQDVAEVTERLKRYLAVDDRFWPRWLAYAERFGIDV
ncbi:MAG: AAA family ATPase [Gammaproteobacteria bacterium]